MMLRNLKIFSQNVWKSNFLINTVLEVNRDFNIIFIQEPLWTTLRSIPSSTNPEGVSLVGIPFHPNWLTFARELLSSNDSPRVITYILMSDFLLFVFHLERTSLIIEIFFLYLSSTTIVPFGS